MPSQPVIRKPSFISTVYPYEITITLSTETPPSTISLPQYETFVRAHSDVYRQINHSDTNFKEEDVIVGSGVQNGGLEGSVPHLATSQEKSGCSSKAPSQEEGERLLHVENDEDGAYREKAIYRQGKFKWTISTGPGPIDAPPPPQNLSGGDVFIRVNINATQKQRTQIWYLTPTLPSGLAWKAIEPLRDIRYIGSDPYVLALYADEPSWILARSAAHPQMQSRRSNATCSAVPKPMHPKEQQRSGRKHIGKGKAGRGG